VHVIVGTPGRVIDHLDKGSLDLSQVRNLVLDEADEMLRMGFVDEVDRILRDTPASRQTALFSATMPPAIRRIAQTHLRDPAEITVASHTGTAANIRQRHWLVSGMHKLDALTRILEAEPFDAMIVFARTKLGTEELAVKLSARGFAAAAINGDMQQVQRERTIGQLKEGVIDILVATDVAARGLDVERISHVINYDVPTDAESYTHRVGRTGRAGRSGEAILFITPRERGLLKAIERSTRQPIALMQLPTIQAVNDVRIARFKASITDTLAEGGLERLVAIIEDYERETDTPAIEIAAALAKLSRGGKPLLIDKTAKDRTAAEGDAQGWEAPETGRAAGFGESRADSRPPASRAPDSAEPRGAPRPRGGARGAPYRVEVGSEHGVKPGNIVGAITNEAGIDYNLIGRVDIFDTYSIVELPPGLPKRVLEPLQKARIAGRPLRLRPLDDEGARPAFKRRGPPAGGSGPGRGSQGGPQGVR
jgi:ATP-dependent RNA helicase DeaD